MIKAAEDLGLSVPDDLSVVGFDGIALDRIVPHDLTTMAQPAAEEGRAAGAAIVRLLEGEPAAPVRFTSRFHRGGTTAPPPPLTGQVRCGARPAPDARPGGDRHAGTPLRRKRFRAAPARRQKSIFPCRVCLG